MSEPDFLSQTALCQNYTERTEWCIDKVTRAKARGATWHRITTRGEAAILYEGWRVQPDDPGTARFHFGFLEITNV